MGDWAYYITFMPMSEIALRVSVAESIHSAITLKELLQRELTNRSSEIETYLREQPQRFFNALVVGTYGGNPEWHELEVRKLESRLNNPPDYLLGALGILSLQGTEKLFAIDGQHRVSGIVKVLESTPARATEEVCVIFVAGVIAAKRTEDPVGFERTRRLFTVLNRYAKPVSKRDLIALDEDDAIAITTRQLVEDYDLFRDKISVKKPKSIPPSDKRSFTTIVTLYDSLDVYLRTQVKGWTKFKRRRPDDATLASFYDQATELLDSMCDHFAPLQTLKDSDSTKNVAAKHRTAKGGHLIFRPIGFQLVVRVIQLLKQHAQLPVDKATRWTAKVPMQLGKEPWVGLLWDATNSRMLTAPENQNAALRLLFHGAGGKLTDVGSSEPLLKKEMAGLLNKPEAEIEIKRYK